MRPFEEKLASHARTSGEARDLGGRLSSGHMRPFLHAPDWVWQRMRARYDDLDDWTEAEWVKWFNSSASEQYNRYKVRDRL